MAIIEPNQGQRISGSNSPVIKVETVTGSV